MLSLKGLVLIFSYTHSWDGYMSYKQNLLTEVLVFLDRGALKIAVRGSMEKNLLKFFPHQFNSYMEVF